MLTADEIQKRSQTVLEPLPGILLPPASDVSSSSTTVYDRLTVLNDVVSTAAETTIYSKSIGAGALDTNKMLRLSLLGNYLHNNAAGDTFTWRFKFGGTTFMAQPSSFGTVTGANRQPHRMTLELGNLGAVNSQYMTVRAIYVGPANGLPTNGIGGNNGGFEELFLGISTLGTIDTSVAQTLAVTGQWSASNVNNSWRTYYGLLELI